jgi:transcriptional regulator of acetoin/glycerol metabolism
MDIHAGDIQRTLDELAGNKSTAAKKLGISRTTLYRKMKKHNKAHANA